MNLNNRSGIYSITNTLNGNVYIGQSVNLKNRKNKHFLLMKNGKGTSPHLQAAYNKYGCEAFTFMPILYCEPFELTRYEQALVDNRKPAYNMQLECVDSARGIKRSEEFKRKSSEAKKGNTYFLGHKHTEEACAKMSESQKGNTNAFGCKRSDEAKRKVGAAQKGNTNCLGRTLTEEHKRKVSEGLKIYFKVHGPLSQETVQKIVAKNTGQKRSPEVCAKMSEAQKRYQTQRRMRENAASQERQEQ